VLWVTAVVLVVFNLGFTSTGDKEELVFNIEVQVRGTGLLRKSLLIKRLSHVTEIPDSEFSLRCFVETSGEDRLVTLKPDKLLRFRSRVTRSNHSCLFGSWIKHKHG